MFRLHRIHLLLQSSGVVRWFHSEALDSGSIEDANSKITRKAIMKSRYVQILSIGPTSIQQKSYPQPPFVATIHKDAWYTYNLKSSDQA